MININLIKNLQERNLIADITDKSTLSEYLLNNIITLYCGFDPTTDSLHLGHLMPLLCLKRFQLAGHRPVILIGGATALIGDPSFLTTERKLNTIENIKIWMNKIQDQISLFLDFNCGTNSAIIVNNYDWFNSMNILDFLREIGKHFSINKMINRKIIKDRLNYNNNGISFTEFSYNLLQSYDFAFLYKRYGVKLQIGGSDQWGNITSGIDLIRRIYKNTVYGLTLPLITTSNGIKFGKTENKNMIWLDANKTSPYKFYQFWVNISDVDVYQYLKFFTFMDIEKINALKIENTITNEIKKNSQYILAKEITRTVHGKDGLEAALRITTNLFTNQFTCLSEGDLTQLSQDGIPTITLKNGANLQQALIDAKLASSKRQARNMINSNAITVNGKLQTSVNYVFCSTDRLYERYTLLRRGKKHHCLIHWN